MEEGSTTHDVEGLHDAYLLKFHDPVNDAGASSKETTRMIGTSGTKLAAVASSKQTPNADDTVSMVTLLFRH